MPIGFRVIVSLAAIAASVFITAAVAPAQCVEGDCGNGRGIYQWPTGARYEGEFKNGDFHGQGTYLWPDGKKFTGTFKNNRRNGHGTYSWPNGSRYTGEWKDGRKHGIGTFSWADGSSYQGQWRDGQKSGMGIYAFPDGTSEAGLWIADEIVQRMERTEVAEKLEKFAEPARQSTLSPPPAAPVVPQPAPPVSSPENAQTPPPRAPSSAPVTKIAEKDAIPAPKPVASPLPDAFDLAVRTLPLDPGNGSNIITRAPLFARGTDRRVGVISLNIETGADKKTVNAELSVENRTDCRMEFTAWLRQNGSYLKLAQWQKEGALPPRGTKTENQTLTLPKNINTAKLQLKPQGRFLTCP